MSVIGSPGDWADLIDPMVPEILGLVVATWRAAPAPAADAREDDITELMCRMLRENRTARELMFQIDTQVVELDPAPGEELGRLDISFRPLIPREDIYFCLECKRLNALVGGHVRSYASEYVVHGMKRFVTGQYSQNVRHGGMLGYVLDSRLDAAIANVSTSIQTHCTALCMEPPGLLRASSVLGNENGARETVHRRAHESIDFLVHHLFMASTDAGTRWADR